MCSRRKIWCGYSYVGKLSAGPYLRTLYGLTDWTRGRAVWLKKKHRSLWSRLRVRHTVDTEPRPEGAVLLKSECLPAHSLAQSGDVGGVVLTVPGVEREVGLQPNIAE